MKRFVTSKITARLLTAAVCMSLCTAPAVNAQEAGGSGLSNPKIESDASAENDKKVTWDCIWFGSYPQAEVVASADSYRAVVKSMLVKGDLIEDSALYEKLQEASGWDANNDIEIDGNKYRRLKKEDATSSTTIGANPDVEEDIESYYNWEHSDPYHYFKYEPIKWRVLKVEGSKAFLLSDEVLDNQNYNAKFEGVTWETSTIRSWLNAYGVSSNKAGIDYSSKSFIGSAFSLEERAAVVDTTVVNSDNRNEVDGGNDTTDKLFLLSESEVDGEGAAAYGLNINNKARRGKCTIYARAMGTYTVLWEKDEGNSTSGWWWLRSLCPLDNNEINDAGCVLPVGAVHSYGSHVYSSDCNNGVRVAMNLDLSAKRHTYAGTVDSNGKEDESRKPDDTPGSGSSDTTNPPAGTNKPVKVSRITLSGISKQIAAGKKIKLTAEIAPSNASVKAVTWKSGNTKVATVNSAGIVTMKKNSGGKSVTITATARDGSGVKASYKIKSMKGAVKKIAISGKKSVKAGKTLKLKAKVTAAKQANKKVKWSSSNKKYAAVSSSGKVKALKAGKGKKVKITVMATDGSGKKKSVTIKIN